MPLGCHERPASAERKKPAVEPATQWPFTRERCRTLGPSSAGDDAPLAASTTKMPLAVPMIAALMLHLQDRPCVGAELTDDRTGQGPSSRTLPPGQRVAFGSPDELVLVRFQILAAHRRRPRGHRIIDGGLHTAQLLYDGEAAERHVDRGVSALVAQDQPASTELICDCHEHARHRAEGLTVRHHAPERIVEAAIEARWHDDQLRPERLERRNDDSLEGGEVGAMTGARR